ncbi:hypothetical protein RchiOBHm_Chr3g0465201 [Rosa chinensis]|uniref:Uncharacterized protein n=1 Tax=Rosa chinensis TaxID=74649 RepID=A0A2P6R9N5_ROSCH|nr:hypothetical protein RchiOBHm_Chr3g0465201 [Rosa chinensis]
MVFILLSGSWSQSRSSSLFSLMLTSTRSLVDLMFHSIQEESFDWYLWSLAELLVNVSMLCYGYCNFLLLLHSELAFRKLNKGLRHDLNFEANAFAQSWIVHVLVFEIKSSCFLVLCFFHSTYIDCSIAVDKTKQRLIICPSHHLFWSTYCLVFSLVILNTLGVHTIKQNKTRLDYLLKSCIFSRVHTVQFFHCFE